MLVFALFTIIFLLEALSNSKFYQDSKIDRFLQALHLKLYTAQIDMNLVYFVWAYSIFPKEGNDSNLCFDIEY